MIAKTGEVIIDAFGVVRPVPTAPLVCDDHLLIQYDYCLNKETGVFEVKEAGKIDLTEVIQSNKDNCGLNLAILNIKRGADPSLYADDGKHSVDTTLLSTNLNEAYEKKLKADEIVAEVCKKLGIAVPKDDTNLEGIVAAAIQKKIDETKVQPVSPVTKGE